MSKKRLLHKAMGWTGKEKLGALVMVAAVLTMMVVCGSIRSGVEQMVERKTYHNQSARLLSAQNRAYSEAESIALLEGVPYVEKVFPQSSRLFGVNMDIGEAEPADVFLVGVDEDLLWPVKAGRQMELAAKEVMVPEVIILKSGERISGETLIGREVFFQYVEPYYINMAMDSDPDKAKVHSDSLEVVGVYEAGEEYILKNQLLLSFEHIQAMSQVTEGNWRQYQEPNQTLMVLTDHYDHLPAVEECLEQMGFNPHKTFYINWGMVHAIKWIALALQVAVLILGAALLGLLQARGIDKHKRDLALLQAVGYTDRILAKVLLIQAEGLAVIAYLVALLLGKISFGYLDIYLFEEMGLTVFTTGFVAGHFALAVLVPAAAMFWTLRKLRKLPAGSILKEDG